MAFVALKALKWALKGQELASDTLEILLANAYHWNPCWKVDDVLHFWLLAFVFHKKTTLWLQNLEFLGLTSALRTCFYLRHGLISPLATPSGDRWRNHLRCDWLKIATLLTRALWLAENRHLTDESSVIGWKSSPYFWNINKQTPKSNMLKCCWNHGKV